MMMKNTTIPFRQSRLLLISIPLILFSCTQPEGVSFYTDTYYADYYFADPRDLYDADDQLKPQYKEAHIRKIEFKKTDKISYELDKSTAVITDATGYLDPNKLYYYDRQKVGLRLTLKMQLDGIETVELLDLQAKAGCLDNKPHPINLAAARLDPSANIQSITFSIKTPCRRYVAEPQDPFESLLMVRVKTREDFYYTVFKLFSFSIDCLNLGCKESEVEYSFGGG